MSDAATRLHRNPALYRAELSARIGKGVIEGSANPPHGVTRTDWVLYQLLSAVEDLARGIAEEKP